MEGCVGAAADSLKDSHLRIPWILSELIAAGLSKQTGGMLERQMRGQACGRLQHWESFHLGVDCWEQQLQCD